MATKEKLIVEVDGDVSGALSGFAKVNSAANSMAGAVTKADVAVKKSQTGFMNLGRVIQDAPFGFMAIQNNLTQLIPSIGIAGIAFSALTAAITFSKVGTTYWSKKTKEAKKDADDFSESLKGAEASALSTGIQLRNFVEIARNGNLPLKQRNEALKEANKLMGEHGDKLTLTNINTEKARKQVELFTQALIQQALATKFADRVADLIIKQKDAAKEYGKAQEEYRKSVRAVAEENSSLAQAELGGGQILPLLKAKNDAYGKLVDNTSAYKVITQELKTVMGELYSSEAQATSIMGELGTKTKDTSNKIDMAGIRAEVLISHIKELLALNSVLKTAGGLGQNLVSAAPARTPVTAPAAPGVFGAMGGTSAFQTILKNEAALNKQNEALKLYKDLTNEASAATQVYTGVFSDLSTALLQGQSLGDALGSVFKKLAADILKAVVQAAIFSAILSAIAPGIGSVAGIAGKSIPGFGDLFKKFLGLGGGFKDGGISNGSSSGHLELLHGKEAIFPMDKLATYTDRAMSAGAYLSRSGSQDSFGGEFVIRGNDLVLAMGRSNSSLKLRRG